MENPQPAIRSLFPALSQKVYGKPLIYLDNGATTQKPQQVIDRVSHWYSLENSNIHRGGHYLSNQGTVAYESARNAIAGFIRAKHSHEIIFTKGTTESINLLAATLGRMLVHKGDEVLVSGMEHHSNFVPWQQLCLDRNADFKLIPLNAIGEIDLVAYENLLETRPKIVAFTHVSNVLGTINPIREMIEMAHRYDIPVVIDAAQSVAHFPLNVQELDCDFLAFSGHKMYGPMGIGVLYGKEKWLHVIPPYQFGGEMVDIVEDQHTSFNVLPFKFEAGTPNVEAVLGLEAAVGFIQEVGFPFIIQHEEHLLHYAIEQLKTIDNLRFIGQAKHQAGVVSFVIGDLHPYDLGMILDKLGIAVRTGHHCAQPVMKRFKLQGTLRASLALYNTTEDIDSLVAGLRMAVAMLS